MTGARETSAGGPRGWFATTRWTYVAQGNLDEIVRLYWRPVYLHLRRKGEPVEDAKDLTQDFFTAFLEKDYAGQADRSRGRFRSFLLAATDHFVANARARSRAVKRGGGAKILSLDVETAEHLLSLDDPPERAFDRQWAAALLDDAMSALEREYAARGQSDAFAALKPALVSGTCEDRVALHRARKRFRKLVRERVARTVASPDELEGELRHLFDSL
ncbi:MAG: sigma-70 family RNA polymerase sigma factor [Planctomycetes bacterium]|nr:sigma-70 family RNA polymerase sigma factor [Planctomycetota bacterium]